MDFFMKLREFVSQFTPAKFILDIQMFSTARKDLSVSVVK